MTHLGSNSMFELQNYNFSKFFLRKNNKEVASIYVKSHGCYGLWGTKRKMGDLKNKYHYLSVKYNAI